MDVINIVTGMSPQTSKKETQAFLGFVGFGERIFWSLL